MHTLPSVTNLVAQWLVVTLVVLVPLNTRASPPWPAFEATTLVGETVSSDVLIGQPTLLVITPSRGASEATRAWVRALRGEFDRSAVLICDILAIDLPFFVSTGEALAKARELVPERFHAHTWLLEDSVLENALDIPPATDEVHVLVLDRNGNIVSRVHGDVASSKTQRIVSALASLTD